MRNPTNGVPKFPLNNRFSGPFEWNTLINGLFGLERRYILGLYVQRALILAAVTITVVVALDLSVNFHSVSSIASDEIGIDGFGRLVYYALLRISFVSPSVLLFAGVWGVVWAEYSLSVSRERIMISNCGHSYLASLLPALWLGAMVGLLQFSIAAYVKPMTVELEAVQTHRQYGPKFERPITTASKWISGNGFILNARIEIAETTTLQNAYLYEFNELGSIQKIITSRRVEPIGNGSVWNFHQATEREFLTNPESQHSSGPTVSDKPIEALEVKLNLNPTWLENFDILPSLLPHSLLNSLIDNSEGISNLYKYQMAVQERYASILYCIATVLLCAYLALTMFPPNMLPLRALGVAFIGYVAYFLFSISLMLGQFGYIPVFIAAWSIPVLITLVFAGLLIGHVSRVKTNIGQQHDWGY